MVRPYRSRILIDISSNAQILSAWSTASPSNLSPSIRRNSHANSPSVRIGGASSLRVSPEKTSILVCGSFVTWRDGPC